MCPSRLNLKLGTAIRLRLGNEKTLSFVHYADVHNSQQDPISPYFTSCIRLYGFRFHDKVKIKKLFADFRVLIPRDIDFIIDYAPRNSLFY
jgi:hypothetical protein